ncbi:Odorant receptor 10 [Ephemera danica]|nr:Odorant receptor 10 [Ephemera danica]
MNWPRRFMQCINMWYHDAFPGSKKHLHRFLRFLQKLILKITYFSIVTLWLANCSYLLITDRHQPFVKNTHSFLIIIRQFFGFCKTVVVHRNKRQMERLLKESFCDITVPTCLGRQLNKYRKSFKKSHKILLINTVYIIITMIPIVLMSPLALTKFLKIENFDIKLLDWNVSTIFPLLIYVIQIFAIVPIVIMMMGSSLYYLGLLCLANGMLDHLNLVLETLHEKRSKFKRRGMTHTNNPEDSPGYQQRVGATLKYIVQHQIKVTRYLKGINNIFSNVLLFEVLSLHVVFSVSAFAIVTAGITSSLVIGMIPALLNYFFNFAFCCWAANDVNVKCSDTLHKSTTHMASWTWDRDNKLLGQCITEYSKVVLRVSAGPFYSLSLNTINTVLSASFSYLLLLYNLNGTL